MSASSPQTNQTPNKQALAEDLVHWFTQSGGYMSPDVRIAYTQSRGFQLLAVKPLHSPVVVTCPLKLTLSCLNLDPHQEGVLDIDSSLQQCRGKIPDHILTYLLLIEQQKKGPDSPWHAYISCLPEPESMTTPLWFDDEDMAFLAGTSLSSAVGERRNEYHKQWEHARSVMKEAGIPLADQVTFESLLWAATIFTSRAFISTHILPGRETVPILFPVVDILNHSATAQVEWDFQPRASFSLKLLGGESFTAGQELFNNYAPKQNEELLLGYGFCLENNPIEQFSLKLAFPPMLQQYAQETGLFKPENLPFGMNSDFLSKDANTYQHFLRTKGHPFGRYENCIPVFRGIPPYIVHFFFIQTMLSLDLDINDVNVQRPGPMITLRVLTLLHQALSQRSQTLSVPIPQQPQNEKQKYAKICRDGQAKIIQTVCNELQVGIARIRTPKGIVPPERPALVTLAEALAAFAAEVPFGEYHCFKEGIKKHELESPADDRIIWTLLLIYVAARWLTDDFHKESLINSWLRTLFAAYPLPELEEGIEDGATYTFIDENLSGFLHMAIYEDVEDATERLNIIGTMLGHHYGKNRPMDRPALVRENTEHLGVRMIMWAMKVVGAEVMPLLEDGVVKMAMYVVPWKPGGGDAKEEEWMYEE